MLLQETLPSSEDLHIAESVVRSSVGSIALATSVEAACHIMHNADDVLAAHGIADKPHHTDTLIDAWMENPTQSLVAEMTYLADELYTDRTITTRVGSEQTDEFVTRDPENDSIDAHYRLIRRDGEPVLATVIARLEGRFELPAVIRFAKGQRQLEVSAQRANGWQETPLSLEEGETGDMVQRALFASTIWAARLAMKRGPVKQDEANARARRLLADFRRTRYGAYAPRHLV